jgi:hypothetical protein
MAVPVAAVAALVVTAVIQAATVPTVVQMAAVAAVVVEVVGVAVGGVTLAEVPRAVVVVVMAQMADRLCRCTPAKMHNFYRSRFLPTKNVRNPRH